MLRSIAVLLLLLLGSPAFADDLTPVDDLSVIVAPKECSGTGKRADPFVFTSGTKCVLRLTGKSATVVFDLEDAPPDAEAIDRVLIFSLAEPGDYLVIATFDGGFAKAWFTIKGANGPPPPPQNVLAAKLKAALVGADAKTDAVKFAEAMRGVADSIEKTPPKVHKTLMAIWNTTLDAVEWPAKKYPLLPEVGRLAIPTADETTAIDAAQLSQIIMNLRLLQKTAEGIANGN